MTDYALTSDDLELVRSVVRQQTAMLIGNGKESFVEARLKTLAQRLGVPTVAELLRRLRARETPALESHVAEVMTVNETLFFRDASPFTALRLEVLPRLIERRAQVRRLEIWSAACSTGQEPLSIAILLREHFPQLRSWHIHILATDVSRQAVERAREARYNELEIGRGLEGCLRDKYFRRDGAHWQAADDVRALIDVKQLNLAGPWPPGPPLDLILMRNVLIYFEMGVRRTILSRARERLSPDGSLLLGSAETTLHLDDAWQTTVTNGTVRYEPRGPRPR